MFQKLQARCICLYVKSGWVLWNARPLPTRYSARAQLATSTSAWERTSEMLLVCLPPVSYISTPCEMYPLHMKCKCLHEMKCNSGFCLPLLLVRLPLMSCISGRMCAPDPRATNEPQVMALFCDGYSLLIRSPAHALLQIASSRSIFSPTPVHLPPPQAVSGELA